MYDTGDGENHQANCYFIVNEKKMKLAASNTEVSNVTTGYVGHSFAQQIETDGTRIYRSDLANVAPRGIFLSISNTSDTVPDRYGTLISIPWKTGENYNYTGFDLGDLAIGADTYIVSFKACNTKDSADYMVDIKYGRKTAAVTITWDD